MSFAGLRDEKDRTDLIVWLMTETGYRTPEMKAEEQERAKNSPAFRLPTDFPRLFLPIRSAERLHPRVCGVNPQGNAGS